MATGELPGPRANRLAESSSSPSTPGCGTSTCSSRPSERREKDTPEGWQELRRALGDPAFADWGRLLHLLARLATPATNPVADLSAFLASRVRPRPRVRPSVYPTSVWMGAAAGALVRTVTPGGGGDQGAFKHGSRSQGLDDELSLPPGERREADVPPRRRAARGAAGEGRDEELKFVWESGGPRRTSSTGWNASRGS